RTLRTSPVDERRRCAGRARRNRRREPGGRCHRFCKFMSGASQGWSAQKRALFSALLNQEHLAPGDAQAIPRRPAGVSIPHSFAQRRLWVTEQMALGSAAYNIAAVLRLEGDFRPDLLERALTE